MSDDGDGMVMTEGLQEAILSGHVPDGSDPSTEALAEAVRGVRTSLLVAPEQEIRERHLDAMRHAERHEQRSRRRRLRRAVTSLAAAAILSVGGLAAAGVLPAPVQDALARLARTVGIELPTSSDDGASPADSPRDSHTESLEGQRLEDVRAPEAPDATDDRSSPDEATPEEDGDDDRNDAGGSTDVQDTEGSEDNAGDAGGSGSGSSTGGGGGGGNDVAGGSGSGSSTGGGGGGGNDLAGGSGSGSSAGGGGGGRGADLGGWGTGPLVDESATKRHGSAQRDA